jgi:hypothetical protein
LYVHSSLHECHGEQDQKWIYEFKEREKQKKVCIPLAQDDHLFFSKQAHTGLEFSFSATTKIHGKTFSYIYTQATRLPKSYAKNTYKPSITTLTDGASINPAPARTTQVFGSPKHKPSGAKGRGFFLQFCSSQGSRFHIITISLGNPCHHMFDWSDGEYQPL